MDWKPYITTDPRIMHGAVCFRGTRIPVSVVLDNLAAGETPERILDQYPSLKLAHIPAAIGSAPDLARERIVPIPVWSRRMPARFKLDENLPRDAEALLRKIGHDVHTVLDERL